MQNNRTVFTFEFNDKGKVKVDGLTKGFVRLETAMKRVTAESARQAAASSKVNTGLGDTISNAGLAGAVLTEFGRTISDSNYGIRGMANNLSQLSTLLITFIGKQEQSGIRGVVSAFRGLGQQLMGPLGIILAFQVLVALLEKFSMEADKAKSATKSFSGSLIENKELLLDINAVLQDTNTSLSQRNDITAAVSATEKDLAKAIESRNLNEEQANELTAKFLSLKEEESELLAESQLQLAELRELGIKQSEIDEGRIKTQTRLSEVNKTLLNLRGQDLSLVGDLIRDYQTEKLGLEDRLESYDKSEAKIKELTKTLGQYGLKQKEITKLLKVGKENKDLIEGSIAFYQEQISILKKAQSAVTDPDDFTELQIRIDKFKEMINTIKGIREEIDAIIVKTDTRLRIDPEDFVEKETKSQKIATDLLKSGLKERQEGFKNYFDNLDILRKTDTKNTEISEEAKMRAVSNTGRAFEAVGSLFQDLAEENKELMIAGIVVEKVGAIAQIIANTAIANAKAVAAFPAAFGQPFVGINTATAAVSIAATTAAAVKAVGAVRSGQDANIGGSATGSSPTGVAPQFNVVGQEVGQMGQLASAITGQTGEPIRAYVVLDDVNSAAELDNKITTSGSIG